MNFLEKKDMSFFPLFVKEMVLKGPVPDTTTLIFPAWF